VEGVDAILVNVILASPCLLDSLNVKEQKVGDAKAQTTISNSVVYLPCFCGGRQPVKVAVDLPNLPLSTLSKLLLLKLSTIEKCGLEHGLAAKSKCKVLNSVELGTSFT
jgi:hypothetical protein